MTPWKVLQFCQNYGEFLTIKMENMTLQHNETVEKKVSVEFKKNLVRKSVAVVTVANGEGLISTFKELGADIVIDGGQGKNPSVEVFLKAYDAVNADVIFVLPNNGNIMMAAKESAKLYKQSEVHVINSKTLGDGYAVLGALDLEGKSVEEILSQMEKDISCSTSLLVSKANRNTKISDLEIKDGNYIGFEGKEILVSSEDKVSCAIELMKNKNADEKEFIVAFYGIDVGVNDKKKFESLISQEFSDVEFYAVSGDQEIYDFIIVLQ
jgi:dihydroxyacetone kinase-like predicted kinase